MTAEDWIKNEDIGQKIKRGNEKIKEERKKGEIAPKMG